MAKTSMFEMDIFTRRETTDTIISKGLYNLIIGLTLTWGFAVNWLIVVSISPESIASINPIVFFIGYLGSCFLGIYLFKRSDKPIVSFIGYNFVVVPFGLVVNMQVSQIDPLIVQDAIRVTGLVTILMMLAGSTFPAFFEKISGALGIALIAVIIIEMVEIFIFGIHHDILDWAVAIIFCGYIGYDWGRANRIPKTVDNAIDSAAALYMDIIILFLRILRIMARR